MSSIFVQIAAYRDLECRPTIIDLFQKAARPRDISVAVCWQFMPGVESETLDLDPFASQVRVLSVDARKTGGVCWARQQAEQFFGGEDHVLQIDSHMRFVANWDDLMREELMRCRDPKAVLTCNPPAYLPPNELEPNPRPMVKRAAPLKPPGDIRCTAEYLDVYPEAPVLTAFVSGAFVFATGDLIRQVPYDPWLYFNQEEITYSMRLYTHGWNVYCPSRVLVYHLYYGSAPVPARPRHWRDFPGWGEYQKIGKARFNHLSKFSMSTDPNVLVDLETYSLGKVRSLEEYQEFCGVDFRTKTVTDHGLQLRFIPGIERLRRNPVRIA
jgi:Glycosyltransferase (GlcNAc)